MRTSFGSGTRSVLFWSVISAAFVGPGTVTTAASAGASFGVALLWTLLFSTLACIILQEAAVRLPLVSGRSLGAAIAARYRDGGSIARRVPLLVVGVILLGGIAYQAGNVLGAVSGAALIFDVPRSVSTILIVGVGAAILWFGSSKIVVHILGALVAFMGVTFIGAAVASDVDWSAAAMASVTPSQPSGSGWLIVGLIGTTIVPYNLFLASGLRHSQRLWEMRIGVAGSVLVGGLISAAILIVGTRVSAPFSFTALAQQLSETVGSGAGSLFGAGLFAAGVTSSLTAPFAAAITARSVFAEDGKTNWGERSARYRAVWLSVVIAGLLFGLSDVRPVPAIILAQAFNGLLLPFVSVFLILVINDARVVPVEGRNHVVGNVIMLVVVGVTIALGLRNIVGAAASSVVTHTDLQAVLLPYIVVASALCMLLVGWRIARRKKNG